MITYTERVIVFNEQYDFYMEQGYDYTQSIQMAATDAAME